jgi:hypothetical protein
MQPGSPHLDGKVEQRVDHGLAQQVGLQAQIPAVQAVQYRSTTAVLVTRVRGHVHA